jgi:hypothetical protein
MMHDTGNIAFVAGIVAATPDWEIWWLLLKSVIPWIESAPKKF